MSVPVVCGACGARLKLPPGFARKKARCPKCNARVDVKSALDATAYLPTVTVKAPAAEKNSPTKPSPPDAASQPRQPEREEDPLPYTNLVPVAASSVSSQAAEKKSTRNAPPSWQPEPLPLDDAPSSLDDDPAPSTSAAAAAPVPFRVPVQVTSDSAKLFTGPCEAVLLPHGIFLESIPYRPFLYVPLRTMVELAGRRSLQVTLPDRRTVVLEFLGRNAALLAEDTAAFINGDRGVPVPAEYRKNPRWVYWFALALALGLASGPLVLSQTTRLGLAAGLKIAGGFVGAGLLANAAIVLFTRLSAPGKVALMALVSVVVTGIFLFAATAYLAGRKDELDELKSDPGQQPPPRPQDGSQPGMGDPPPAMRPPSAIDVAYRDGVFRYEDGPAEVTSLAVGADGVALIVGYKNGDTRVWRFDRPTLEPFDPGPKSDGAPTRIQFDSSGTIVYLVCNGGTVAALWNAPPEVPLKIPGDPFAVHAHAGGERFAVQRGNTLTIRQVPTAMIRKPNPGKSKGFVLTTPKDEPIPPDAKAPLNPPRERPTFLAWHPTGKLLAGLSDGSILSWGATGPSSSVISREHKGAVRAWAASPATWDFATGDDKGMIGLWANKAMNPKTFIASAASPITKLVFSPTGAHLAATDAEGIVSVWDVSGPRALLKVRRPNAKAIAFGPADDLLLLSDDRAVELWFIPELDKQP
jgi:hypothetical protein